MWEWCVCHLCHCVRLISINDCALNHHPVLHVVMQCCVGVVCTSPAVLQRAACTSLHTWHSITMLVSKALFSTACCCHTAILTVLLSSCCSHTAILTVLLTSSCFLAAAHKLLLTSSCFLAAAFELLLSYCCYTHLVSTTCTDSPKQKKTLRSRSSRGE